MDARPFRPRGAENMPSLHQRHKSTGNISSMAAASIAGFRGPAKRAAFGDVTNMVKNLSNARDEIKVVKVQASVASFHAPAPIISNKENVPYTRDAFSRPAQRSVPMGNKSKAGPETKPVGTVTRQLPTADLELAEQLPIIDLDLPRSQPTADEHLAKSSILPQGSFEAPPLQPRHHKSQPQLKQQQPTLRRTQSKQLEKVIDPSDSNTALNIKTEAGTTIHHVDQVHIHNSHVDQSYLKQEPHVDVIHSDYYSELAAKLPEITEEEALVSIGYKEGTAPAMSEPEDCWDEEDEEDYDDQDQAYTTAHSFRSRDMTTGGITAVVQPRVTARVQRELEEAKLEVHKTRSRFEIEEEMWDVSMVAEYGDEIFEYMRDLEIKMLPNPHYMDIQTEIQWSMRSVLMDWLVQVHNRFNLLPETLFLTVNYIDRFLSAKIVSIGKLQLVGATAILVASKYEEINCPSLQEIIYMVDGGYTMDEILKAERFMLSMLSFELGWPGPMSFLRRVSKADDYDLETRTLAKYFLELTIMDERFVASPPSFLAAGAHCLSRLILKKGDWTKQHVHFSGYTWGQIRSLVTMMIECCDHPRLHHSAIFDKYSEKRFKEASSIVQRALDEGFALPHHSAPVRLILAPPAHKDESSEQIQYAQGQLVPIEG